MQRTLATCILVSLMTALSASCTTGTIQGGPVPAERLVDGVYRGSARNGPVLAVVDVVVEDRRIERIEIVRHGDWWGRRAEERIPDRIVEQQSTQVDAVTGATISSTAIMNAVQDAVEQATN